MEKLKQATEFIFSSYKRTAAILFIAALTLAIPITINFLGQGQDIRQQAALVCENVAADIMLVIDKSGSMDTGSGSNKPIQKTKVAANSFIDILAAGNNNRVGLVSFASNNNSTMNSPLTSNFNSVKQQVNNLNASGKTCTECGIKLANDQITSGKRQGIKNVVVLLTDGRANATTSNNSASFQAASTAALNRVTQGFEQNGTVYFTIGLGNDIQADFLQEIANLSGGKYFAAPTADDLQSIYAQISQIVGKASVSGFVYNDENDNGIMDDGEEKLSGWTLNLTNSQTTGEPINITSDASGGFSFSGLCGGEYTLSAVEKTEWTITTPMNNLYEIILLNGDSMTEKSFGVKTGAVLPQPTQTPTIPAPTCTPRPTDTTNAVEPDGGWCPAPDTTSLDLSLTLTGIGSSSNPALGLNDNPKRPEREVEVKIFNAQNQEIKSTTGTVAYDTETGAYKTIINLGSEITSGSYLVKTRLDNTLWKTIPGIQNIVSGTNNTAQTTRLVTGDVNQDNEINLLDYNMFLTCLHTNQCGNNNGEGLGLLIDKFFSVLKEIFMPKNVFAQTTSQTACNALRQQLTYLQSNNLCGTIICNQITTYMQRVGCSTTPQPTTPAATSPTGITMPTNLLCNTSNPTCPSGYTCTTITGNFGACIPSLSGFPSPTSTPNASPTQAQTPSPTSITATSSPTSAPSPTANPNVNTPQKALFDFNDDGIIDELDLNILYAGFANRQGD